MSERVSDGIKPKGRKKLMFGSRKKEGLHNSSLYVCNGGTTRVPKNHILGITISTDYFGKCLFTVRFGLVQGAAISGIWTGFHSVQLRPSVHWNGCVCILFDKCFL